MTKLLLSLLLLTLPACCTTPSPVSPQVDPCLVTPIPPAPSLNFTDCGSAVCLPVADAKALAKWTFAVGQSAADIAACKFVVPRAPVKLSSETAATHPNPSTTPASDAFARQKKVIAEMRDLYPNVEVDVTWMPCGEENGMYMPILQRITLCTEFEADPDVGVYAAAHEMAHAIQEQTYDTTSEQDADELAALTLIKLGYRNEVYAASAWWAKHDEQAHQEGDVHPGAGFRAWELRCIANGSLPAELATQECADLYRGLKVRWDHRMETP